jgi:DEAD/DEAH box helicase domain-containing protein
MTRRWLEADPAHIFHLVIDDLHSYRGTPGTEVAYIIRVLVNRLGLHPDHRQLRILASSASLGHDGDEARAQEYLSQFFGRSTSFELIRGGAPALQPGARAALGHLATPFTDLSTAIASNASEALNAAVDHFAEQAAVTIPDTAQPAERRLGAVLSAALAPDAVRAACNGGTDENPTIVPRTPSDIGTVLFPNASSSAALESASGLLAALARALSAQGNPLLPLRAHLFFRNVQGVWACSNPSCTQVSRNNRNILIGRLFDRPTTTCDCGSRPRAPLLRTVRRCFPRWIPS